MSKKFLFALLYVFTDCLIMNGLRGSEIYVGISNCYYESSQDYQAQQQVKEKEIHYI